MAANPFFEDWDTPFGLPPFDRIEAAHFAPAFDRAMAEHKAEIAAIAGAAAPPSFANTVEALERSGRRLDRVSHVFHNLNASATSDALDAIARDYAPKLAAHHSAIMLDAALFARLDAIYRERHRLGLDPDQIRLIERHHLRFVRAGALLGPADKARMAEITARMATLHTQFGQNVLHDEDEWHLALDAGDLDGLPDFAREAAAAAAKERGLDGKYAITLARASVEPFLAFSARPAPHRLRGLGRARRAPGRARQPPADRRIDRLARRAGAAARLFRLRGLPACRYHGQGPHGGRPPLAPGVGAGLCQGRRRARGIAGGGARRRAQRADRAVGLALLCREGAAGDLRLRRSGGEAVFRARQRRRRDVRHRRAAVRSHLRGAARLPGLSPGCPRLYRER